MIGWETRGGKRVDDVVGCRSGKGKETDAESGGNRKLYSYIWQSVVLLGVRNQQSFPTILIGGHCAGNIMALSGKPWEEVTEKEK